MLFTMKQFKKVVREEMERYDTKTKEEEKGMRWVSGFICGAESCFRPWELLHPSRSLYFPWGRKRCRKYMEEVFDGLINECYFHRIDVVGAGPFGKIALEVMEQYQQERPDVKMRVWIPGGASAYTIARDNRRFSKYKCDLAYFASRDGFLRMETAMILHSDMGVCFDLGPRAKKRIQLMQCESERRIYNFADKDFAVQWKIEE